MDARRRLCDRGVEKMVGEGICEGRLLGGTGAAMVCTRELGESPETRCGQARGITHLTNNTSVNIRKGGRR